MTQSIKSPSSKRRSLFLLPTIGWAVLLCTTFACDGRDQRTQTRVGVAIALETRSTAANLADAIANRPDTSCGRYTLEGPVIVHTSWTVEGFRHRELVLSLVETRTMEIDADGRARFVREVQFVSDDGTSGERSREWRLIDSQLYHQEDGQPFTRRQVSATEEPNLLGEASEVFETMVRATTTQWNRIDQTTDGVIAEVNDSNTPGVRIRCGTEGEPDPWLSVLQADARVEQAQIQVRWDPETHQTTERLGRWTMTNAGQDSTLIVAVDEEVNWGAVSTPIEIPDELADTSRNRFYHQLTGFLRELDRRMETETR